MTSAEGQQLMIGLEPSTELTLGSPRKPSIQKPEDILDRLGEWPLVWKGMLTSFEPTSSGARHQRLNVSLKELVAERDSQLDELHAALDEEQQRKRIEQESWKAELATTQDTWSALRRDIEGMLSEMSIQKGQLGIVGEDQKAVRSAHTHPTAAAEVQTIPPMAKVKSRDAQTDLTGTSLAQMECDSVSYSSELKALYSAYAELRETIGQLVVKNIEPLPNTSDIACIVKSCKEMSRLIHHETRRRENQANELAATTAKVEDLRQKGALEVGGAFSKNVSENCAIDAEAHAKKFGDPMRQTLFVLTAMAMDLVKQLRRLSLLNTAGKQVKILERDNRTLHEDVKVWQKEYEALEEQHKGNPELGDRITRQIYSIHSVMSELTQVLDSFNT